MFQAIVQDPYVDANLPDTQDFGKARKLSVIFSAFHKMLYQKEKYPMKRVHAQVKQELSRGQIQPHYGHRVPAPVSVSNKSMLEKTRVSAKNKKVFTFMSP